MQFTIHMVALRHWVMDPRIEPYVRASGFYYLTQMGYTRSDHRLLQALVERWRPETNTFHLRHGEMTVTLQDVAVLTGLPIDGKPVTGITDCDDWGHVCEDLLGVGPLAEKIKGGRIYLSWLKETFSIVPDIDLDDDILQQYARAYILFVLGSTIFANGTEIRYMHVIFIYLEIWMMLADIPGVQLRWPTCIERCTRVVCLERGRLQDLMDFIRCYRWKVTQRFDENSRVLIYYRAQLDYQLESQVIWQPYVGTYAVLPFACRDHMELWLARVSLICFDIVEMHVPDRVTRQFGVHQDIPSTVEVIDRVNRRVASYPKFEEIYGVVLGENSQTYHTSTTPTPPSRLCRTTFGGVTQNISEVLARGLVLYPNYDEWGRIIAVARDYAEAMMGEREQPSSTSSAATDDDDYSRDVIDDSAFGPGADTEFTIDEFFGDVRLEPELDEQPPQPAPVSDQAPEMPLQTYIRRPRRIWCTSTTANRGLGESFTTPAQSAAPSSTTTDVPSSSAPPAPRKAKKKGFMKFFG
ncbi:hypothetical protein QJS04_geneDACA016812 [Acorus gramineus]|uniref:Aminotransferase-like plant mobile domain-containing protein n=1 Tax=Acorus gramineus TaxID=55184 RepID=A0AAV9A0Y9_ACOGR|nr:hypothetical protein QJS04_geneDACA016812 [Acorus gramineus]